MPANRPPAWLFVLAALALIGVGAAAFIWLNRTPPSMSIVNDAAPAEANASAPLPPGESRSIEQEIACVDRAMATTAPGSDIRNILARCRYQPSADEVRNAAAAGIDLTLPPPPANAATPGELPPRPAIPR